MQILILSDIHANFPALEGILQAVKIDTFQHIINCGDATVYATFPNKTLSWLQCNNVISILGNTDIKVLRSLKGKTFKKPKKAEKRVMYTWTVDNLEKKQKAFLESLPQSCELKIKGRKVGVFHGSPENPDEQLFTGTSNRRFREIARKSECDIILCGHSHTPFHKKIKGIHFINPGSVGRMFDGDPRASYAILEINQDSITVTHFRVEYNLRKTIDGITNELLPPIYREMYLQGKKLN